MSGGNLSTTITNELNLLQQEADYNNTKYEYQSQSFASLYIINQILIYIYYLLFIIIVGYILYRHLRPLGTPSIARNIKNDAFALAFFASFPFWIIHVEEYIYRMFAFLGSLIKNSVYVNHFYTLVQ
jgi:hypothetical protein